MTDTIINLKIINMITKFYKEYKINIKLLQNIIKNHKKYLYLMNNIKLVLIYQWDNFKKEYKYIKYKIKQNNQLYHNIIKLYNDKSNYYNSYESNIIQTKINDIYNKKNNIFFDFNNLLIIHKDVNYNHNKLLKSKKNILINYYTTTINDLVDQLYYYIKQIIKLKYECNSIKKKMTI